MEINDRIQNLIDKLQLNPNAFAETVGVTSTVIYNIVKGRRSKPSFEVLQKILLTYQAINANWLLNGDGKIWKDEVNNQDFDQSEYSITENKFTSIIASLREEVGEKHQLDQLEEIISSLMKETVEQKFKIISLYEKQDQILDVIKKKLNLDF